MSNTPWKDIAPVEGDSKGTVLGFDKSSGEPTLLNLADLYSASRALARVTAKDIEAWKEAANLAHSSDKENSSHYRKTEVWSRSQLGQRCPVKGGAIHLSWLNKLSLVGIWNSPSANSISTVKGRNVGIGLDSSSEIPQELLQLNGALFFGKHSQPGDTTRRLYSATEGLYYEGTRLNTVKSETPVPFADLPREATPGDIRSFSLLGRKYWTVFKNDDRWSPINPDPRASETILTEVSFVEDNIEGKDLLQVTEPGWELFPTRVVAIVKNTTGVAAGLSIVLRQKADGILRPVTTANFSLYKEEGTQYLAFDIDMSKGMFATTIGKPLTISILKTAKLAGLSDSAFTFQVFGTARRTQ